MALRRVIMALVLCHPLAVWSAEVSGFRVWADPEKTRAVLDLSEASEYRLFTLDRPHRVVIDLDAGRVATRLQLDPEHAGIIQGVRQGTPKPATLRIVLDLERQAKLKSFLLEPTGQYGHRLVVDLYDASSPSPEAVKTVADVQQPNRDVLIAIDAGHGGEDPGATGPRRTREKDVVLQIARVLKAKIDAEPGMRGYLVRDGDYYIALRDRYEKARRARADLFVSIHADAFRDARVEGSSVFVLSRRGASSEYARLIADSENRSDLVGGVKLNEKDDMLASVLLDLSQSATMGASNEVAESILAALARNGKTHKDHVGRASFMVLKSPDVPSVLVETAFISNHKEEKRLTQREFQQRMSQSIADGIRNYFHRRPPPGTWLASNRGAARHIVARGDTLDGIARRYQVSLNSLRRANNISGSGDRILVGTELVIPTG
ncbi:MAG: AMIN domain-containing protein [Xanthomonadales bacterium]|nr:AMIN domain-containing protein [Xanthomonadales bacterium]NIN60791.1 AMIN domain-containing protein [Xanthomonadales bacterium]NIN76153.1 AMIN domain-containing protein [Xanthomonadales bacterium]NIO15374.1 AMIN domain-containing protein [Xanthomonadales bacterium]NIP13184.1 AMIN domain-containing protein [Xanthomonadales bacterium]